MAKRDYYDVLGVGRRATADEIRKAHRRLVRQYHPDAKSSDPKSTEKFKEVQEAYDVLSDPTKRGNYDQFGHAATDGAGRSAGVDPFEAFRRSGRGGRRPGRKTGPEVSVEDFQFGEGGFGDIFEQLFGGRGGGQRGPMPRGRGPAQAPPPAEDMEQTLNLTFEQAARGTTVSFQLGFDGQSETIEVKIPPGVNDGGRVRIRGKGRPSPVGRGDLYIITRITPHAFFRRDGLDILLDVPVSLYEALNGAKVTVPTLDGPVSLTIPPGSSSGTKLRIRQRGIERGGEKGDQFVLLKIVIPRELDDEDRAAMEKIARKHPLDPRSNLGWPGGD